MKEMRLIIIIIILVGILLVISYFVNQKSKQQINDDRGMKNIAIQQFAIQREQISKLESKEFYCSGITGFTFKYPIFEGLEYGDPQITTSQSCEIFITGNFISTEAAGKNPRIKVETIYYDGLFNLSGPGVQTNDKNVKYSEVIVGSATEPLMGGFPYQFYGKDFEVRISLLDLNGNMNFKHLLFWQSVIDSFEFVAPSQKM